VNAKQAEWLAALIELHREAIGRVWTERVRQQLAARYERPPLAELAVVSLRGLSALIEAIETDSARNLDAWVSEIATASLDAGYDISAGVEAIQMLREAILPFVLEADAPEPSQTLDAIILLDSRLRIMLTRFATIFTEAVKQRLLEQQQTAQLLANSESMLRVTSALLQKIVTLEEVLELVCFEARRLIGASGSAVLLVEGGWLMVTTSSGTPSPSLDRLAIGDSFAGHVIAQGKPLLLNDSDGQIQAYYRNPDLKALLAVPLKAGETIIGALDVVNKPGGFGEKDIQILRLFANQAAIAIENARLHERGKQLAVLQERQRLARELHDSVTQAIYSINLYAEASRMALAAGKVAVASENLKELRSMAREATLDMRMLIFEMHQPAWEEEGLASALRIRLEAVEARSGLQTEFQVQGEERLPLIVEEELYRIAQEALTNAVRHAGAQKVIVRLNAEPDRYFLEIEDDGRGFDSADAGHGGGLGLRSMRERVQRINGELTIHSAAGAGTAIRVEVNTQ
jgi:signal transduction histidine kinase